MPDGQLENVSGTAISRRAMASRLLPWIIAAICFVILMLSEVGIFLFGRGFK